VWPESKRVRAEGGAGLDGKPVLVAQGAGDVGEERGEAGDRLVELARDAEAVAVAVAGGDGVGGVGAEVAGADGDDRVVERGGLHGIAELGFEAGEVGLDAEGAGVLGPEELGREIGGTTEVGGGIFFAIENPGRWHRCCCRGPGL